MNKKILLAMSLIVACIVGGIIYLSSKPVEAPASTAPVDTSKPAEEGEAAGHYVDYSPATLADSEGTRLLFFHAAWCPQCRELDADIKSNGVPAGVTILKVDYDSNQQLRQKYGVTQQTTLVKIDANGDLVEKYVAYDDPSLSAVKENLL